MDKELYQYKLWDEFIHSQTSTVPWSLEMDKMFHPTLYF